MAAFIIWAICGVMFIGFGISAFRSERAAGFWANAKTPEMKDVKAYNQAVGRLWCIAGVILILLGIPLLTEDKNPLMVVLVSVVGVMIEMIVMMVVYSLGIEGKYRKK